MAYNNDIVTADFYAVLVPDTWKYGGETHVRGVRVDRTRSNKPSLKRGEIAVRVKLNFDKKSIIESIPVVEANVTGFSVFSPESIEVSA